MRLVTFFILIACVALPFPSLAYDEYNGEKVPPYTRNGGSVNLVHEWVVHHGARLYWRSTQIPIQLRLAGREFKDPADVPLLDMKSVFDEKKKSSRRVYRRRAKRVKKVRRKPVVQTAARTSQIAPMKPHPQRALGPVRKKKKISVGVQPPMKPVDPVGNPLQ